MKNTDDFYTIRDVHTDNLEVRLNFNTDYNIDTYLHLEDSVGIDNQQLFELGILFAGIALRNAKEINEPLDYDSAGEVLNGFKIPIHPALRSLTGDFLG